MDDVRAVLDTRWVGTRRIVWLLRGWGNVCLYLRRRTQIGLLH